MLNTLTILASDPRKRPVTDPAIDAVRKKLEARTTNHHEIQPAHSVEQIGVVLKKVAARGPRKCPDRIQIIGHGAMGMLSLGYPWTEKYSGSKGTYVLDSNPFTYGVLHQPMKRSAEVLILGCSVGDDDDDRNPMLADGLVLIFDLARMWDCTVGASTDLVSSDDFDENGVFTSRHRLQLVTGTKFKAPTAKRKADVSSVSKPVMNWKRVCSAPCLRRRSGLLKNIPMPGAVREAVTSTFDKEIELGHVLALPDLVFDGDWEGKPATADFLARGRVLRVTCGGKVRHFEANRHELPELRRTVREFVKRKLSAG